MIPYDAEMISKLLRSMPQERLATIKASDFHMWPAQAITKAAVIGEMIAHEKQRRMR